MRGQKDETRQAGCAGSQPFPPGPAAVRLPTGAEWGRGPGPAGRHSRLRSAAPLPPAGPLFGRCSCLDLASPSSLGRRGEMVKRRQKTRETRKAAGAAKKPASLQGLPWTSARAAESELSGTDTNYLSTARALTPGAPPPLSEVPPSLLVGVCPRRRYILRDSQSDASRFTLGRSLLQLYKAPHRLRRLFSRRLQVPGCHTRGCGRVALWNS